MYMILVGKNNKRGKSTIFSGVFTRLQALSCGSKCFRAISRVYVRFPAFS